MCARMKRAGKLINVFFSFCKDIIVSVSVLRAKKDL